MTVPRENMNCPHDLPLFGLWRWPGKMMSALQMGDNLNLLPQSSGINCTLHCDLSGKTGCSETHLSRGSHSSRSCVGSEIHPRTRINGRETARQLSRETPLSADRTTSDNSSRPRVARARLRRDHAAQISGCHPSDQARDQDQARADQREAAEAVQSVHVRQSSFVASVGGASCCANHRFLSRNRQIFGRTKMSAKKSGLGKGKFLSRISCGSLRRASPTSFSPKLGTLIPAPHAVGAAGRAGRAAMCFAACSSTFSLASSCESQPKSYPTRRTA